MYSCFQYLAVVVVTTTTNPLLVVDYLASDVSDIQHQHLISSSTQ